MELKTYGDTIEVNGVIKTISDAQEIIDAIKNVQGNSLRLIVKDSFALPSSIIGYLIKKSEEDVKIVVEVGSDILAELLDDLNLTKIFNVRKL